MALVDVDGLTYAYPHADAPALRDVSLRLEAGETVALFGPSGGGKSTLLRALAGLVPHFHGGRFAGRVLVAGRDTRSTRPAELAGTVASVFQDPEDQIVMTSVGNEVAFGLENVGVRPGEIGARAEAALRDLGAGALVRRRTSELSGGELQRVCLAAAHALRPAVLLLDEPTSQLDPDGADAFLSRVRQTGATVVLSEQRVERVLPLVDRVVFVEEGRLLCDAPRAAALEWLERARPSYARAMSRPSPASVPSDAVASVENAWFGYDEKEVLGGVSLAVRRGEIVALEGPNGSGKSTLAKLAAGLLEPSAGHVVRNGRVGYVSQDPGRYLACETVVDEVALAVGGRREPALAALDEVGLRWAAARHPRDLSSGERERLAIAAVAVAEPDLLVLDEPTRGIDPERKAALQRWLVRYAAARRGVLVATHDASFPAHRRVSLAATPAREERRAA